MSLIDRRQLLHGTLASAALGTAGPVRAQVGDSTPAAMARTASAFLASLEPGQRRAAAFSFAQDERMNWHYIPRSRSGVPFKEMSAAGRAAAYELIKVSLSGVGYAKAVSVMKLEEDVLRRLDECMMVAAHNGDLAAASAVGLRTAFVPRPTEHGPGQTKDLTPARDWDVVARDFVDLASRLGC